MSLTKQLRREKISHGGAGGNNNKDTRWDRIRKKYMNNSGGSSLKSEAVRRFIEIDFIGANQKKLLNGEKDNACTLNPLLVMDMRHQMFQRNSKKLPLATIAQQEKVDKCVAHNLEIEERQINCELNRFRAQLERQHKRNKLKTSTVNSLREEPDTQDLENTLLMRSLAATARHIQDFYATPIEALEANASLCLHSHALMKEESSDKENEVIVEITNFAQELEYCNSDAEEQQGQQVHMSSDYNNEAAIHCAAANQEELRCVRFGSAVEVVNYQRESSNCSISSSIGLDSVISDLAEEALNELKLEEEEQNKAEEVQHENEDPLVATTSAELELPVAPVESSNPDFLTITQLKVPEKLVIPLPNISEPSDDAASSQLSTASNHEQNLIIAQLFQSRAHATNIATLRKYFLKWIHYTTITRIENQNFTSKRDRITKINAFLDEIRREKVRQHKQPVKLQSHENEAAKPPAVNVQAAKKYQNKIKIQQDIIDLQRIKLERQERMIMQLKLNKLTEEAKEARQEIKNELKSIIRSGDPKMKAKAKCLQLIGNLKDAEDEKLARLQGRALLVPQFLQNMQERALERSIKHEQARQRRLLQEAEREAQKAAAEEAKRLEDEEAKHQRIEALKEKRRLEKMAKVLKERERQRAIESNHKAQEHCRRYLLKRIGMQGFQRLIQLKRENRARSERLRRHLIQKHAFVAWRNFYILSCERRIMLADELYCRILKRQSMRCWQRYVQDERSKFYVAVDWFDFKLSEAVFLRWYSYSKQQKMIEDTKLHQAASHHEWHLKWKVLDRWQCLPQILQLEKETEERRQRWRMKIWELLPDYKPNRDEEI